MFFTELETERLHLQNLGAKHRYFFFVLCANDDVLRFHYPEDRLTDVYAADAEMAEWTQPEPRDMHQWVLVRKADGVALGTCCVNHWDKRAAFCEVHYDMHPDFWGSGYMTEAMRAVLTFAGDKMKVRRIEVAVAQENEKSKRLLERLGFVYTGQTVEDTHDGSFDKVFRFDFVGG